MNKKIKKVVILGSAAIKIGEAGEFDETPGTGIAFQVDVEDAIGVRHQIAALTEAVEDML